MIRVRMIDYVTEETICEGDVLQLPARGDVLRIGNALSSSTRVVRDVVWPVAIVEKKIVSHFPGTHGSPVVLVLEKR